MKETILGAFIGLMLLIGATTGVIYVTEGFTPLAQRLCVLGVVWAIISAVGWVAASP